MKTRHLASCLAAFFVAAILSQDTSPQDLQTIQPVVQGQVARSYSKVVEMNGLAYRVVLRDGRLSVSQSPVDALDSRPKYCNLEDNEGAVGEVRQAVIGRWGNSGLFVVIKRKVAEQYVFTYYNAQVLSSKFEGLKWWKTHFAESKDSIRILACDGQNDGDTIVVLLGAVDVVDDDKVSIRKCVTFVDTCPNPPTDAKVEIQVFGDLQVVAPR